MGSGASMCVCVCVCVCVCAENKRMEKNIEWGDCDPQQNDGMYLFQLHDSKEF